LVAILWANIKCGTPGKGVKGSGKAGETIRFSCPARESIKEELL
jgi:hypothetical protein